MVTDMRRLCARVAALPLFTATGGGGPSLSLCGRVGQDDGCGLLLLEESLEAVRAAAGLTGCMTASAAKELLRRVGHDGARLAARLGRLSKGRNAAVHPDVGSAAAIAGLFHDVSVQGSEYQESAGLRETKLPRECARLELPGGRCERVWLRPRGW